MLTAQETDQLVHDLQHEFPMLAVSEKKYGLDNEFIVVVRDATRQHQVEITSLTSDWRNTVVGMAEGQPGAATAPDR